MVNLSIKYLKIYVRDKGVCGLCLKDVEVSDGNLDHIKHKHQGGTRKDFNMRLTHKWCNSIRGKNTNKMLPEYYLTHKLYKHE